MEVKSHIVIDLIYTEEEGNQVFAGTLKECENFVAEQDTYGLVVRPMTKYELLIHNLEKKS